MPRLGHVVISRLGHVEMPRLGHVVINKLGHVVINRLGHVVLPWLGHVVIPRPCLVGPHLGVGRLLALVARNVTVRLGVGPALLGREDVIQHRIIPFSSVHW